MGTTTNPPRVRHRRRPAAQPDPAGQSTKSAYDVGYGTPPVHTRFQPGQSGNPKGRPKGSGDPMAHIRAQLNKKATIHIDGRPVRMALIAAVTWKQLHGALQGDARATGSLVRLLELSARFAPPEASAEQAANADGPQMFTADDMAFIERELKRLGIGV